MSGSLILTALARSMQWSLTPYRTLPVVYDCRYMDSQQECAILEVAETMEDKRRGLMYRTYLPQAYGMIFVREEESVRTFWMKNTLIPLDIIFLDDQKNVVDQTTMMPCKADPCPTYTSRAPAQYVVEMMHRD